MLQFLLEKPPLLKLHRGNFSEKPPSFIFGRGRDGMDGGSAEKTREGTVVIGAVPSSDAAPKP